MSDFDHSMLSRRRLLAGVAYTTPPGVAVFSALENQRETSPLSASANGTIPVYNVRASPYSAVGDGIADDTAAISAAIGDCHAAGGGIVYLPAGIYLTTATLELPSFTSWGEAWDEDNPIRLLGEGPNLTFINYTGVDSYAIAHPTIGSSTNRGQNAGVEIAGFTLVGPQDYQNTAHGIGIDNTRRPYIHEVYIRGFPGGVGIHLYGHAKGGVFGARIDFCRFGTNEFTVLNGHTLYSLDVLRQNSMRYGIWLDGAYETTGKVNDTLIKDNQFYDLLIGFVRISGHGEYDPDISHGSSANTMSRSNVYFTEAARKLEEGILTSVANRSTMTLRQSDVLYTTDGDLEGLYLAAKDTLGRWHRRYIESFMGMNREVLLASPLPFDADTSTSYRVGFADGSARADFPDPVVLQHVFYWNSAYSMTSIGDYFEETVSVVAGMNANSHVEIISPVDVVNDGIYGMREDGAGFWCPRTLMGMAPRGSDQAPAHTVTETILLLNSDTVSADTALLRLMMNDTGDSVLNGDVIRQGTAGGTLIAKASSAYASSTGHYPHFIVYNASHNHFPHGQYFTVALTGSIVDVNSDAAASVGDCLMSQTGNMATPIAQATLTPEYAMRVLGVAIESTSGAGPVRVRVR